MTPNILALTAALLLMLLLAACRATGQDGLVKPQGPAASVEPHGPEEDTEARGCPQPKARPDQGSGRQPLAAGRLSYDPGSNTIRLGAGGPTTLPMLAQALRRPDLLSELAPGEWLLAANLHVDRGATLAVAGPEVSWLKLHSDPQGFVWIKALGGTLSFSDTCVSSWDPAQGEVDSDYADGRSFILARDGARLTIVRSKLHHLGYAANESYGLAFRLAGTSGEVADSELAYNYYGLYSFQASDLVIRGNRVHHSVRYGIDPHTSSNRLLIQGNESYRNGKHGIILAEGCSDSQILDNRVYENAMHGIVLFNASDHNLVAGNSAYSNAMQGINVNNSSDNTLRGNVVYDNGQSGIGVGQGAQANVLDQNTARANREHGIYLFSDARDNTLRQNVVSGNARYGIYLKSGPNQLADDNQAHANGGGDVRSEDR